MRILSILLSVLSVAVNVPSGRGLQLGRNPHALIKISLSHSRLRANPVDDLPELQNVAQDTPFAAMSSVLPRLILQTSVGMFLLSAPLGMMLDNYHGLFGVLEYNPIGKPIQFAYEGHTLLKTASWVPFLFGFAGFLMSAIILTLDSTLKTKDDIRSPSWPKVLYGISLFSGQYYLSGLLDNSLVNSSQIDGILKAIAVIGFLSLDRSRAGFALAVATAVGGPLAEIFLINIPNLYNYVHPDVLGIPIWIGWVYFLGAPAVGNLARRLLLDKLVMEE